MSEWSSQTHPLPWQQAQWSRLRQQAERAQMPHALLLAGAPGVGKRRFARALGAGLLCLQPSEGVACNACRTCLLLAAGTHPDWLWLAPDETGKAIKIDAVRQAVETMARTAQQGGIKLLVLEPAEAMNRNAANALLKTLEEPAGSALILLIADAPAQLLPTIRSRCQQLLFPLPPCEPAREWLLGFGHGEESVGAALREAGGRPLAARELLEGEGLAIRQRQSEELARLLGGQLSPLVVAERWLEPSWDALLSWLQAQLGEGIRAVVTGAASDSPLARLPAPALFTALDRLHRLIAQTRAGTNPNRLLALEAWLLYLCDAVDSK